MGFGFWARTLAGFFEVEKGREEMIRKLNFGMGVGLALALGLIWTAVLHGQTAASVQGAATWRAPSIAAVQVSGGRGPFTAAVLVSNDGTITNSGDAEFELTSAKELKAKPGDVFEVKVRIKVDLHTRALPELACYDAAGREIAGASSRASGPGNLAPYWLEYERFFPALPGTASVRARIRGAGRGATQVADLVFRPAKVDPYQTGALISQPYPTIRHGVVLESNLGIVNQELVSGEDRDGDGKWALIRVDLDKLTKLQWQAVDWRTMMQYNPNLIYWSDGTVLKSDTVRDDRSPDPMRALHFRMKVHAGPYRATMNDPGRAVAVSLDGKSWKRYEGGREADLGVLPMKDGVIELWIDACYRDPVSVGSAYFDYVRLMPEDDPAADERLFLAAWRKPPETVRGSADERRVPVTVRAPQFAGGANWPVRCGIPIPQGELSSADNATVLDASGSPVATQNRVAAVWPDGSVKWLYMDFRHDFSKSGEAHYTVAYGNNVRRRAPEAQVKINETGSGMEVDTGAIRFTVPRARFGLIENVRTADGRVVQAGPVTSEITELYGDVWPVPDASLEIEQAGPLHAVVAASARGYRARIHAYAGSPLVEIDYFIANMDIREMVQIKSIVLKVPAAGAGSGAQIAATADAKTPGWVSVGNMGVGVAAFREQYPKALRWTPQGLSIDLWAPEGGTYTWYQGVGKTHHIDLFYAQAAGDGALLANGPVLAVATPEWYTASGAFGPIETAAKGPLPLVEKTLAEHISRRVVGEVGLGFENYGDHLSPAYVKGASMWIDNEYDTPAAAILGFVRTGDAAALRVGLASAQHYADVDCIHFSTRSLNWVGGPHSHSHDIWGHHTSDPPNTSHTGPVQGAIWASYLSGDPGGLEAAKGVAEWALRNLSPQQNIGGMERQSGLPMMTLMNVYEATWDERYLRGAATLVDWTMRWEDPVHSGFLAPITEFPAYSSGSSYNSGLLSAALLEFNSFAHLPEVDAMLERFARHILTEMWRPPAGIVQKGAAALVGDPLHISTHLPLMRAEYLRTGDPLFLAVPREAVVAAFEGSDSWSFDPPAIQAPKGDFDPDWHSGHRASGLVFKHLPCFLALLREQGNPRPGGVEVSPVRETVEMAKGGTTPVCFAVKNTSSSPVEDLRIAFQPRLDFSVGRPPATPASLGPGQSANVCYEVRAPEKINLTLELNRISYAHWSATFRSQGQPGVAHSWVRIALQ
jgi:hypothetical protein